MSGSELVSPFVFVTCQPGAEKFVKADVTRRHKHLRFSFSRPGFVTFKWPDGAIHTNVEAPTVLARCWGPSFGTALRGAGAVDAACTRLASLAGARHPVLHAFARDTFPPGDEPEGYDTWAADASLAERVTASPECRWPVQAEPRRGQLVLDVIEVDAGVVFTGAHVHGGAHRPTPGGRPPKRAPPPETPSRVWLKIEEAFWWSGVAPGNNDVVLDIGCAPGGGTLALLQRGARVVGVDPGDMHPAVAAHPRFQHLAVPFERLDPAALPQDLTWAVYDVNLSPLLVLGALRRLLQGLPGVRHAFLTLKLNKLEHVERLDWMLAQLRGAGFAHLRVTQLFHNRQELFVHARR
ncbi:MAG: hypothetical protein HY904_10565 [Deltaproteobacteria bacterium]|nr:hypothetical protein [Deltaproteobacteria bacterium]